MTEISLIVTLNIQLNSTMKLLTNANWFETRYVCKTQIPHLGNTCPKCPWPRPTDLSSDKDHLHVDVSQCIWIKFKFYWVKCPPATGRSVCHDTNITTDRTTCSKQTRESTEGYSRWKVEKRHGKFGKTSLNWSISKFQKGGRNQVSRRVSVSWWRAIPVGNVPWKLLVIRWMSIPVTRS